MRISPIQSAIPCAWVFAWAGLAPVFGKDAVPFRSGDSVSSQVKASAPAKAPTNPSESSPVKPLAGSSSTPALPLAAEADSLTALLRPDSAPQVVLRDSAGSGLKDSLMDERLLEMTSLLRRSDSLRRVDSLHRDSLEREVSRARGDSLKAREITEHLAALSTRDSMERVNRVRKIEALRSLTQGIPVAPFGDTLFQVYARLGPLSPTERARLIHMRLQGLIDSAAFDPDSIRINLSDEAVEVSYRGEILLAVTEDDALWLGKPQDSLASEYRGLLAQAVTAERDKRSWIGIWVKVGLIVLIVVGLIAMVKGINFLFRLVRIRVRRQYAELFAGIKIKNYELLTPQRELRLAMGALEVLRYAVILFSFYIALPLLFSVFPWTRGLAATLFDWVVTPFKGIVMGVIGYIPNFLTITVIFVCTHYVVKFLRFLSEEVEAENLKFSGFYPDWARPTFHLLRIVLYLFMFVVIFPYLPGSDSAVFKGVSVFLGVLFSLGSSSAVANMVAGIILTYMRSFSLGDRVRIGEVTGDIMERTLLVTRVKTPKNEIITLPNSSVLGGHTVNYSAAADRQELILHTTVTLGYDLDWRKAHELLRQAASRTDGVLAEPTPFVLQTALGDYSVAYELNAFTGSSHRIPAILSGLHQNIQDVFKEAGVEILSPAYHSLRDGNAMALPKDGLPAGYQAPPFHVRVGDARKGA